MTEEKKERKKTKKLSTTQMILIILGVILIIFLVAGSRLGWDELFPWLDKSNVDEIVSDCNSACNANDAGSFCNLNMEVKGASFGDGIYTCEQLIDKNIGVNPCEICIKPGEQEYVWVVGEHNCLDKSKNQDLVDIVNCDLDTRPLKGICCEQDRQ